MSGDNLVKNQKHTHPHHDSSGGYSFLGIDSRTVSHSFSMSLKVKTGPMSLYYLSILAVFVRVPTRY